MYFSAILEGYFHSTTSKPGAGREAKTKQKLLLKFLFHSFPGSEKATGMEMEIPKCERSVRATAVMSSSQPLSEDATDASQQPLPMTADPKPFGVHCRVFLLPGAAGVKHHLQLPAECPVTEPRRPVLTSRER